MHILRTPRRLGMKWLIALAVLFSAGSASALTSTCSWYNDNGTPWVYGGHTYTASEALTYLAIESYTIMYQPFSDWVIDFWFTEAGGDTIGHETPVTTNTDVIYVSQGTLGNYAGPTFIRQLTDSCTGNFRFNLPETSVVITPSIVNVGDPVTISWGSSEADACEHNGAPIEPNGAVNLIASLADTGTYTLECSNQWGASSDSATLTVN